MKKFSAVLTLAGVLAVVSASHADTHRQRDPGVNARQHNQRERAALRDPGVNQRQTNQTGRIAHGVKSGELTHDEAHALRTERRDIRELERRYKDDGALTRDERQDLHQQLNQQGREIYEEKHDEEKR